MLLATEQTQLPRSYYSHTHIQYVIIHVCVCATRVPAPMCINWSFPSSDW